MNIARFRIMFPGHPLSTIFAIMQSGECDPATAKGMAAGMVALLAHLKHLPIKDAEQLLTEIAPDILTGAFEPLSKTVH
jgi:hypothetical protein